MDGLFTKGGFYPAAGVSVHIEAIVSSYTCRCQCLHRYHEISRVAIIILCNTLAFQSDRYYLRKTIRLTQFNFIAGSSGVMQVQVGRTKQHLVAPPQTITKNG